MASKDTDIGKEKEKKAPKDDSGGKESTATAAESSNGKQSWPETPEWLKKWSTGHRGGPRTRYQMRLYDPDEGVYRDEDFVVENGKIVLRKASVPVPDLPQAKPTS
jgi:hypothetical protein